MYIDFRYVYLKSYWFKFRIYLDLNRYKAVSGRVIAHASVTLYVASSSLVDIRFRIWIVPKWFPFGIFMYKWRVWSWLRMNAGGMLNSARRLPLNNVRRCLRKIVAWAVYVSRWESGTLNTRCMVWSFIGYQSDERYSWILSGSEKGERLKTIRSNLNLFKIGLQISSDCKKLAHKTSGTYRWDSLFIKIPQFKYECRD